MAEPYIGEIIMFAGNYAPTGWALCNGQPMNIMQYQALYAVIGIKFGGDGKTTFNLPNLQGRVPVHAGVLTVNGTGTYPLGQSGGQESVTLAVGQMPSHNHTATGGAQVANVEGTLPGPAGNVPAQIANPDGSGDYPAYAPLSAATGTFGGNSSAIGLTGGNLPHENRPPYCVVNFIIALTGIYPTHD